MRTVAAAALVAALVSTGPVQAAPPFGGPLPTTSCGTLTIIVESEHASVECDGVLRQIGDVISLGAGVARAAAGTACALEPDGPLLLVRCDDVRPFLADHERRITAAARVLVCGSHGPLGDVNCDDTARDIAILKGLVYVIVAEAPGLILFEVCEANPPGLPADVHCQ